MNILFLTNELRYTCGVTNHLLHLTSGLTENPDHKLFIIAGGGDGIDRFKNIKAEILSDKRFLHENRNSVNYLSAINLLSRFIKQNKIDIIHSHTHYAANIASHATLVKRILKIQTNHGLLNDGGKLSHFSADKYIAINEHIYKFLIENKIAKPEDVKFIRCGVFVPAHPSKKTDGPVKVIAASRFTFNKGIDIYIRAIGKLPEEIKKKAEFYIAGFGEEENNLKKLNEELTTGVTFLGNLKNIDDVLKETHIFVYPSRSKNEGFPAVITEAGAYNNLLVVSDFIGVESVIQNNIDGLVFKSEDDTSLAKKITEAITNYTGLSKIPENFYRKVRELFDKDKMITKHEELYNQCQKA